MWIFTKDGFFSAVFDKHCKNDELMIRSRCQDDLGRLSKKLHGYSDETEIFGMEHVDYRFRMKVSKHEWTDYLRNCVYDIDYANVKDNIIPAGDNLRQDAYYQVWTALYQWQSKLNNEQPPCYNVAHPIEILDNFALVITINRLGCFC